MSNVQIFEWQVCDDRKPLPACVATVTCLATDSPVSIGIDNISLRDVSIPVEWVLIDNYANGTTQTVNMGPLTKVVAAYSRAVYRVPRQARAISLTLDADVNVIVSNVQDFLEAAADEIAIQQAANQFVSYPWITLTAGRAQLQATDQNRNLLLSAATAQNYTLLDATSLPNGYLNPHIRNAAAGRWSIVPLAGQTINGIWTNANPLMLSQENSIMLSNDGGQWQARGHISFKTPQQTISAAGGLTIAHGLNVVPSGFGTFGECIAANVGYSIGQRTQVPSHSDNTSRISWAGVVCDNTNVNIRFGNSATPDVTNFTTGARTVITTASWRYVVDCWYDF